MRTLAIVLAWEAICCVGGAAIVWPHAVAMARPMAPVWRSVVVKVASYAVPCAPGRRCQRTPWT